MSISREERINFASECETTIFKASYKRLLSTHHRRDRPSISSTLLQNVKLQSQGIVQEAALNSPSTRQTIQDAFVLFVAGVPATMAAASAEGGNYAEMMTLRENRDYSNKTWKDRLFSKAPHSENLKGLAALVYAWCHENGLEPFLAPYFGSSRNESRIVIQWDNTQLQSAAGLDGAFLAELQAATAAAQTKEMVKRERERLKEVRTKIAELHRRLADYKIRGWTSATLGELYSGVKAINLRQTNTWADDVVPYCENLGLKVSVETSEHNSGLFDGWCHTITVSWEAKAS